MKEIKRIFSAVMLVLWTIVTYPLRFLGWVAAAACSAFMLGFMDDYPCFIETMACWGGDEEDE